MPCGWEVKAGMVCVWVAGKTVWSPCYTRVISERFEVVVHNDKALYKYQILYFTCGTCRNLFTAEMLFVIPTQCSQSNEGCDYIVRITQQFVVGVCVNVARCDSTDSNEWVSEWCEEPGTSCISCYGIRAVMYACGLSLLLTNGVVTWLLYVVTHRFLTGLAALPGDYWEEVKTCGKEAALITRDDLGKLLKWIGDALLIYWAICDNTASFSC